MLSPVRLFRSVKLTALPGPRVVPICCPVWMGSVGKRSATDNRRRRQEDDSEEALDEDAVEAKLESLENEARLKRKSTKFHMIRRQLSECGAPKRMLSWDAIEQIRYLKQESPQEWTLQRLADSFSVSPDVISRILRSKFTPTLERKLKQDAKVFATIGALSLGDGQTDLSKKGRTGLPMPNRPVPALLSEGNTGALMALNPKLNPKALVPNELEKTLVPLAVTASRSGGTSQISTVAQSTSQEQPDEKQDVQEAKDLKREEEEEDELDGVFLTEEEVEELVKTLHEKPSAVEQKGREFFDCEGKFLYRI